MNPCHHSVSFPEAALAPPVCHTPSLSCKHTQIHSFGKIPPTFSFSYQNTATGTQVTQQSRSGKFPYVWLRPNKNRKSSKMKGRIKTFACLITLLL